MSPPAPEDINCVISFMIPSDYPLRYLPVARTCHQRLRAASLILTSWGSAREGGARHSISSACNFPCQVSVWTRDDGAADIMLSRVTFNFAGGNLVFSLSKRCSQSMVPERSRDRAGPLESAHPRAERLPARPLCLPVTALSGYLGLSPGRVPHPHCPAHLGAPTGGMCPLLWKPGWFSQ